MLKASPTAVDPYLGPRAVALALLALHSLAQGETKARPVLRQKIVEARTGHIPQVEAEALGRLKEILVAGTKVDMLTELERHNAKVADDNFKKDPCSLAGVQCEGGHVTAVSLRKSKLGNNLPVELRTLTHLRRLDVARCELEGGIPEWLGTLGYLQKLNLGQNQFSGPIPPSLADITDLDTLILSDNKLEGALPDVSGMDKLALISVEGNRLSGPIPESLGLLPALIKVTFTRRKARHRGHRGDRHEQTYATDSADNGLLTCPTRWPSAAILKPGIDCIHSAIHVDEEL